MQYLKRGSRCDSLVSLTFEPLFPQAGKRDVASGENMSGRRVYRAGRIQLGIPHLFALHLSLNNLIISHHPATINRHQQPPTTTISPSPNTGLPKDAQIPTMSNYSNSNPRSIYEHTYGSNSLDMTTEGRTASTATGPETHMTPAACESAQFLLFG
jgi:hypothetical protein